MGKAFRQPCPTLALPESRLKRARLSESAGPADASKPSSSSAMSSSSRPEAEVAKLLTTTTKAEAAKLPTGRIPQTRSRSKMAQAPALETDIAQAPALETAADPPAAPGPSSLVGAVAAVSVGVGVAPTGPPAPSRPSSLVRVMTQTAVRVRAAAASPIRALARLAASKPSSPEAVPQAHPRSPQVNGARSSPFTRSRARATEEPNPTDLPSNVPSSSSSANSLLTLAAKAQAGSQLPVARPTAGTPPRASVKAERPVALPAETFSQLLTLTSPVLARADGEAAAPSVSDGPSWQCSGRARLLSLEIQDFKTFERKSFSFKEEGLTCIVGCNSSGKTTLLDALRFVLLRQGERSLLSFVRWSKPACEFARVTARFQSDNSELSLVREVREAAAGDKPFATSHWVSEGSEKLRDVSEQGYAAWISRALGWADGDLLLPQFGLMDGRSAAMLLQGLPAELDRLRDLHAGGSSAPLLKRRSLRPGGAAAIPEVSPPRSRGSVAAEAWLARRVDEVYRELTREPLDEKMESWGEGGQACLRRLDNGSFDLFISERRGAAACGYGTCLDSLSDGDKDVCAVALLLALPGLLAGLQETLPGFVLLDEPDSRLDKRHALALQRFVSGPSGPTQCLWLSLNNHGALRGDIVLDTPEVHRD